MEPNNIYMIMSSNNLWLMIVLKQTQVRDGLSQGGSLEMKLYWSIELFTATVLFMCCISNVRSIITSTSNWQIYQHSPCHIQ